MLNPPISNISSGKAEFIFLLDRSGSMNGNKIRNAKKALILFLKSLPLGSYFNVYSFGSEYNSLYNSSVEYLDDNLNTSINKIENFQADMGSTEIYDPL